MMMARYWALPEASAALKLGQKSHRKIVPEVKRERKRERESP